MRRVARFFLSPNRLTRAHQPLNLPNGAQVFVRVEVLSAKDLNNADEADELIEAIPRPDQYDSQRGEIFMNSHYVDDGEAAPVDPEPELKEPSLNQAIDDTAGLTQDPTEATNEGNQEDNSMGTASNDPADFGSGPSGSDGGNPDNAAGSEAPAVSEGATDAVETDASAGQAAQPGN